MLECLVQIYKTIQSRRFLGKLFGPLLKIGLPKIKNVIKALAKSVLIPSRLTAGAFPADAGNQKKKTLRSGPTLIISNEEMNDMMKIVQALENSNNSNI